MNRATRSRRALPGKYAPEHGEQCPHSSRRYGRALTGLKKRRVQSVTIEERRRGAGGEWPPKEQSVLSWLR